MSREVRLITRCHISHRYQIITLDYNYKTVPHHFNMPQLRQEHSIIKSTGSALLLFSLATVVN